MSSCKKGLSESEIVDILDKIDSNLSDLEEENDSFDEDANDAETHVLAEINIDPEDDILIDSSIRRKFNKENVLESSFSDFREEVFEAIESEDEVFEKATFYTNLYATQRNVTGYKNATKEEIEVLIGLQIAMGNSMTMRRFAQLRTLLHFTDNLKIPKECGDKFVKIRPLIDAIRNRCLEEPVEQDVCIDEQIIPFKGRLSCKVYHKGKPNPW
ncbi:PREDICTED: piggyBac transposable element-derived protein 3-like, partial [Rhagoletis zephyria]|uniref:piggyBac transposable element-derived protein 3-like n=1 Tax=Rhagoletis zephyria TaxID=28612 RepID=UPI0008113863